jgi:hypothetical protein
MGFLKKLFNRRAAVQQLPSGSITVDRQGHVVISTISSVYPREWLQAIGRDVVELFHEARAAGLPLAEAGLHYGSLAVTAREQRGGAIIFLFPKSALMPAPNPSRL